MKLLGGTRRPAWAMLALRVHLGLAFMPWLKLLQALETGHDLTDLAHLPEARDTNLDLHVLSGLQIQKCCIFTDILVSHTHTQINIEEAS